jgi:excisionase family DNA binding protein
MRDNTRTLQARYNGQDKSRHSILGWEEMAMSEIMTPEQVAAFLQVPTSTVLRLIRDRQIAASKVGRTYRIRLEDFDAYLGSNSAKPEVIAGLTRAFLAIAERNPGVNSDDVLDELEAIDEEFKRERAAVQ